MRPVLQIKIAAGDHIEPELAAVRAARLETGQLQKRHAAGQIPQFAVLDHAVDLPAQQAVVDAHTGGPDEKLVRKRNLPAARRVLRRADRRGGRIAHRFRRERLDFGRPGEDAAGAENRTAAGQERLVADRKTDRPLGQHAAAHIPERDAPERNARRIRRGSVDGIDHEALPGKSGGNVCLVTPVDGLLTDQVKRFRRTVEPGGEQRFDLAVGLRHRRVVHLDFERRIVIMAQRDLPSLPEQCQNGIDFPAVHHCLLLSFTVLLSLADQEVPSQPESRSV